RPPPPAPFPYTTLFRSLEHLVRDREREPRPAGASRAKALTGRDRDAVLEQSLRRQPLGEFPPEVERALRLDLRDHLAHELASPRSEEHTSELQSRVDLV